MSLTEAAYALLIFAYLGNRSLCLVLSPSVHPQAWQQPQQQPQMRHECLLGQWQQQQQQWFAYTDQMDHQASTHSRLSMGNDPGAFANSLKGICTVFITSALAFASIELVRLAALETPTLLWRHYCCLAICPYPWLAKALVSMWPPMYVPLSPTLHPHNYTLLISIDSHPLHWSLYLVHHPLPCLLLRPHAPLVLTYLGKGLCILYSLSLCASLNLTMTTPTTLDETQVPNQAMTTTMICICGWSNAPPGQHMQHAHYGWRPGAFTNGLKGICTVFVISA